MPPSRPSHRDASKHMHANLKTSRSKFHLRSRSRGKGQIRFWRVNVIIFVGDRRNYTRYMNTNCIWRPKDILHAARCNIAASAHMLTRDVKWPQRGRELKLVMFWPRGFSDMIFVKVAAQTGHYDRIYSLLDFSTVFQWRSHGLITLWPQVNELEHARYACCYSP